MQARLIRSAIGDLQSVATHTRSSWAAMSESERDRVAHKLTPTNQAAVAVVVAAVIGVIVACFRRCTFAAVRLSVGVDVVDSWLLSVASIANGCCWAINCHKMPFQRATQHWCPFDTSHNGRQCFVNAAVSVKFGISIRIAASSGTVRVCTRVVWWASGFLVL